jgi:hypothetical protein
MEGQSIVIITSDFLPIPSANGVCAYNLAKVLMKRGYAIDVISNRGVRQKRTESIDDIAIRRINNQYITPYIRNKNIQSLILRTNLFLHLFIYPIDSICAIFRYFSTTINVIKQNNTSIIICLNNPLLGCLSGVYAKRKFGNKLKFVVYDVDSFSNTLEGRFISLSKKRKMMWKWEKIVFRAADLAIVMRNHETHYNQEKYKQFKHKMRIANFPMLYTHLSSRPKQRPGSQNIECVYLGSLSQTYRNPNIVCEIFSRIPNVILRFFGRTDNVKTIIEKFSGETQGRIHHGGMVSFLQGQEILQNSDVLISIGNRDSDMVPSKTFEYMSYCKPIIHFYTFKEDPVISTLSQYPVALLLDTNGPIQSLVEQTKEFLSTYSKMSVEPKIIRELLYENTPEFSIDLIEGFFAQ